MIHAYHLPPGTETPELLADPAAIAKRHEAGHGLLWVDLEAPTDEERAVLRDVFDFHPVTIDICAEVTAHPLVHAYDNYLFLVLHAVDFRKRDHLVRTLEVDIYWGENLVVTHHRDPIRTLTEVRAHCENQATTLMSRTTEFFVFTLVDRIIDNFGPSLQRIDEGIEACERAAFRDPRDAVLQEILSLKRSAVHLARIASAQRDVAGRLMRGEFDLVTQEGLAYWRSAYEHLFRMAQAVDAQRDLVNAARDTYLSVLSNRMNEVMKVLTIIATIFIPITFVAGIYGMNFEWMPELRAPWGYPAALGVMAAVAGGMLVYFRRKKWI